MKPALLLDIINEKEEYKVEKVQNHRKQGYSTQFLVHWKGYRNEYNQKIAETGFPHTEQGFHILKKQFKTIGQSFQDEIYKRRG